MVKFREPFSFIINPLSQGKEKIVDLFEITGFVEDKVDIGRIDGLYLLGPNRLVTEMINSERYRRKFSEQNPNFEILETESICKGLYIPINFQGKDLPVVMYYKLVPELQEKPVLTKEYRMLPGEFLIVPESSEYICAVSYQDSRLDAKTELPEDFKWVNFSRKGYRATGIEILETEQEDRTILGRNIVSGNTVELDVDLFETSMKEIERIRLLDSDPFQIRPFLSNSDYNSFKIAIENSNCWIRRTGDIYTQVAMDIVEWSKDDKCPQIIGKVLDKFSSSEMIERLSFLTGVSLNKLWEVSAYRMVADEFVNNHADGTFNGQLKVRVNWLIQNPTNRKTDMRFWNPKKPNGDVCIFTAIENSITVFHMGAANPHDITPIPDLIDKDRMNLVITYG